MATADRTIKLDYRYPIGGFEKPPEYTDASRREAIDAIAAMPVNLRAALSGLGAKELDTPYRPDGWTVRQLVHHLADSHMNAFIRFKLAMTENNPTIKAYNEAVWAETPDVRDLPAEVSTPIIESVHQRWVALLHAMKPTDFARTLQHPERGSMTLDDMLALYGWHSRHHVAHVTSLRQRNGW